jgi:hypothetical protein
MDHDRKVLAELAFRKKDGSHLAPVKKGVRRRTVFPWPKASGMSIRLPRTPSPKKVSDVSSGAKVPDRVSLLVRPQGDALGSEIRLNVPYHAAVRSRPGAIFSFKSNLAKTYQVVSAKIYPAVELRESGVSPSGEV